MDGLKIGGKIVSNETKALIIAEAGINHDGRFDQAVELIDMAAEAGADVVKFQLFKAEKMYTHRAGEYRTARGDVRPILDILKESELDVQWIPSLMQRCSERKLGFLCTVCDERAASVLNEYGVDSYKMASYAITHLPLLKYVAMYQKPVIISTAGARISDVDNAVRTIYEAGNRSVAIMHCVAKYPTPIRECNLGVIKTFRYAFPDCLIGYSDHTEDPTTAPAAAVALGAKIIEKHITIDKNLPGADHSFAVDYTGLKELCRTVRETECLDDETKKKLVPEEIVGSTAKITTESEQFLRKYAYRCIFATKDIHTGEELTRDNTAILRPGNEERGIEPYMYEELLSKNVKITKQVMSGKAVQWENILSI